MFDPFENVKVTFEGIAPYGSVSISEGKSDVSNLEYIADVWDGLSNGDKITVTVESPNDDDILDYCMGYGKIPSATEKEYTVEGLAGYVMSLDEIPQDVLDKMDAQAKDMFNAYVAQDWTDAESLKSVKLIGNYFVYPKDSSMNVYTNNYLYFIYKITAKNADDDGKEFSYYYYSYYTDIMTLEDGTCSFDLSDVHVPEGSSFFGTTSGEAFSTGNYYYKGYKELDSLFNKQITSKIGEYSYESTVEDK